MNTSTKVNKVLWKDSMFMYPQHLQQQDVYYENLINNYQLLQPYHNWGIIELDIDQSYLKLNKIYIRKCIGILPNGMFFSFPDRDDIPEPIDIPDNCCDTMVYIGITMHNNYNLNRDRRNKNDKYYAVEEEITDLTAPTLENRKSITLAKLNLNILLGEESGDQMMTLPILKIKNISHDIHLEECFIAPYLRFNASDCLVEYNNIVLSLLNNYIHSNAVFTGGDNASEQLNKIEDLLILQTITNAKYALELLSKEHFSSPYALFKEMISLISSLIIFTKNTPLEYLTLEYNHANLEGSFEPVMRQIHSIITILVDNKPMLINLADTGNGIHKAQLSHCMHLEKSLLIVGIELASNIDDVREHIVHSLKIASQADISGIVNLQVSGIKFNILHTVPFYVRYNENTLYLQIENKEQYWRKLTEEKNITVYLNNKITAVSAMKLWIIPQTN
jgi:type VI secretion system protein ImpJ